MALLWLGSCRSVPINDPRWMREGGSALHGSAPIGFTPRPPCVSSKETIRKRNTPCIFIRSPEIAIHRSTRRLFKHHDLPSPRGVCRTILFTPVVSPACGFEVKIKKPPFPPLHSPIPASNSSRSVFLLRMVLIFGQRVCCLCLLLEAEGTRPCLPRSAQPRASAPGKRWLGFRAFAPAPHLPPGLLPLTLQTQAACHRLLRAALVKGTFLLGLRVCSKEGE